MEILKTVSILLLMSVVSFSTCISMNSTDLINTNQTVNTQCIYLEDLNATISPVQNITTVNLNVSNSSLDPISGTTYICNADQINLNQILNFSGNYSNSLHNLSISCPTAPIFEPKKYNVTESLPIGQFYRNDEANITIFGSTTTVNALNQFYPLLYSQSYVNPFLNLTVVCQGPYTINQSITLSPGQAYRDSITNLSVLGISSTNITQINQFVTLFCDQTQTFPGNLTVKGPVCVNLKRALNYSEHIIDAPNGIDLIAPPLPTLPTLNQNVPLTSGDNYTNAQLGLKVTCTPTQAQSIQFCQNTTDAGLVSIWQQMNLTNYTCNTYSYQCVDNITPLCSPSEKYSPQGLISCANRIANDTANQCNITTNANNICQQSLIQCRAGQKEVSDAVTKVAENDSDRYIWALSLLVVMVFIGNHVLKRKHQEGAL